MKLYSLVGAFQAEYLDQSPADVVSRMDGNMRTRMRELGPLVAKWFWLAAQAAGFKPGKSDG
jgi:hypothetical protein